MRIRILFLLFMYLSNTYALDQKIDIGLLYNKIFSSKNEADIGSKLWIKQLDLKERTDFLEISLYEDEKKLLDNFINNKIKMMIIDATFYFKNKELIDNIETYKWIMSRTDRRFEQFYLITNKDTNLNYYDKQIKNIYYKLDLGTVWLDTLLVKKGMKKLDLSKKYKIVRNSKKLVFDQFFKKGSYSIVSKDLYDLMTTLNPQVKEKVRIVKKSDEIFFRALAITRKDIDKESDDLILSISNKINTTESHFGNMSFVDIQTVYELTQEELDKLENLYQIYFSKRTN